MATNRWDYKKVNKRTLNVAKAIFKENEEWIMDPNVKTHYPLPDPKEDSETPKYFEEYKRLGGKDELEKYIDNLRTFFKITFGSYVHGDSSKPVKGKYWISRDEAWMCFVGFTGSLKEAKRYFASVDNIHPYS
jgi:hypothetical protein